MNPNDYEEHPGPLRQGDLIVLQVHKWLMPHVAPGGKDPGRPQCYVVLSDQRESEPVGLRHVEHSPTARRYKCAHWRPSEFAELLEMA